MDELHDQSALIGDRDALRELMRDEGVIFLRGALDSDAVGTVRDAIARVLVDAGWVNDGETLQATPSVCPPGRPGFGDVYARVQSIEAAHRLVFDSMLPDVVGGIFDEDVFVHPGKVVRMMAPDPDGAFRTRPHQDFPVLQSTADTVTCWTPLVSCPPERGGLILRPGSHREGYIEPDGDGFGPYPVFLAVNDDLPGWATATYEPGDVVMFHGLTVHGSLPNTTDRLRMSMEFRFQSVADPIMAATLRPNRAQEVPPWDVLTEGWSSREWVEVPPEVQVVRPPAGSTFEQLLRELTVPPSRFVSTSPV